ncbi:RNA-binding protein 7 [Eudromia elegans]
MGAAAAEADRTLFVGNLDPKVTEELIFELFHQAGPVIKVKIPKDRDGKPKQFAFVNFKHEESVPYGMSLLNGIKLFGRPLKIQFRAGSSHASPDGNAPLAPHASRYDRSPDHMAPVQRSPDNLQRQAMLGGGARQQAPYGGRFEQGGGFGVPGYAPGPPYGPGMPRRPEGPPALRKARMGSHPYFHFGRDQRFGERAPDYGRAKRDDYGYEERSMEQHYRAGREECGYGDRIRDGWSHDYDSRRESYREGRWCPARH